MDLIGAVDTLHVRGRSIRYASRWCLAFVCGLSAVLLSPSSAVAGTYVVTSCTGGSGTGTNSLFTSSSTVGGYAVVGCVSGRGMETGMSDPNAPQFYHGALFLAAPTGAGITSVTLGMYHSFSGNAYAGQVVSNLYGFGGPQTNPFDYFPGATYGSTWGWGTVTLAMPNSGTMGLATICVTSPNCSGAWAVSYWSDVYVTISDTVAPTVTVTGGGQTWGGWIRGTQSISFDSSDAVGVRNRYQYRDAALVNTANSTCNYALVAPCPISMPGGSWSVDTTTLSTGAHTTYIRVVDSAAVATNSATYTYYVDNVAPIAPASVADGGGASHWQQSISSIPASWPAGSDANAGVHSYVLCIATATSCGGTQIYNANVGNVTSASPALAMTAGTVYYACVYTLDASLDSAGNPGNTSGWRCADGVRGDNVQPTAFTVSDSLGADITYINATTSLAGNWTVSTDANSGLNRYDYCISTSSTGADCASGATRTWTSNALTTSVTAAGLPTLTNGTTYYVCVRAVDNVSNVRTACSNGQRIDTTNPSAPTLVSPADDIGIAAWPALTATYIDPAPATPGLLRFQACSDAACTSVLGSSSSATGLTTGTNGSWTPGLGAATYYWRARGEDGAGNIGAWSATRLIIVGGSFVSISIDAPTQNLGMLVPTVNATATSVVTVSTNAANGYQLSARDPNTGWGVSNGTGGTIPDWTGTVGTPSVWASGTTGYFGITVRNATGTRLAKWGPGTGWPANDYTNNRYAGLTAAAQLIHSRATYATAAETVTVTYRTNIDTTQLAGTYATQIDYTIVGLP
jgi:hypothetical protein